MMEIAELRRLASERAVNGEQFTVSKTPIKMIRGSNVERAQANNQSVLN